MSDYPEVVCFQCKGTGKDPFLAEKQFPLNLAKCQTCLGFGTLDPPIEASTPYCPYCGAAQNDYTDLPDQGETEIECESCERPFRVEVSLHYSTRPLDEEELEEHGYQVGDED